MPEPRCPECRAPLARDQRYCLECGARVAAAPRFPSQARVAAVARPAARPLPAPRVAAFLFLVLLGFGVLVGQAANPELGATLAAARRPDLRIVLPAPAPPRRAPAAPPAAAAPPSGDTRPPAAAAPTPEPVAAPAPTPASHSAKPTPAVTPPAPAPKAPPLEHVWVVSLAGQPYARTLGDPRAMPYLAGLRARGETLTHFHAVGGSGLSNGIALLAGADPTPDHDAGCPTYADGCVLGPDTFTLPDQLAANGHGWRAYVESIGTPCRHPALGQPDPWPPAPRPGDAFATQRDPFAYFHTIIDSPDCAGHVVGLDALAGDLAAPARTPAVSYVVPDLCHDGRDQPCADGMPAGPAAADAWLKSTVGAILDSRAYADHGLVVITSDHAPGTAAVGALLLSRYVARGADVAQRYDSVSLLRALQDAFSLRYLGDSADDRRPRFGRAVWSRWSQDVHRANTGP